jgi:hypothetical protein
MLRDTVIGRLGYEQYPSLRPLYKLGKHSDDRA